MSLYCDINTMEDVEQEKSKLRNMKRSWVFLLLLECPISSRVFISQCTDISDGFILLLSNIFDAFVWAMSLSSDINMVASESACALYLKYLVNKPLLAAGISKDNVRGLEMVRKMNIWPRSEASRANEIFWGPSLIRGHFPSIYQWARRGLFIL